MRASELMCRPVRTCLESDAAHVAARLMWEHDVGTVPVVDGDGRLVGIVTDRDLCMAVYTQGKTLDAFPVTIAMAREVVTCAPGDSIREVEKLMRRKTVRRLPVVDAERHPVGLISLNDIARATARRRSESGKPEREFVKTMEAICRHRRPGQKVEVAVPEDY